MGVPPSEAFSPKSLEELDEVQSAVEETAEVVEDKEAEASA